MSDREELYGKLRHIVEHVEDADGWTEKGTVTVYQGPRSLDEDEPPVLYRYKHRGPMPRGVRWLINRATSVGPEHLRAHLIESLWSSRNGLKFSRDLEEHRDLVIEPIGPLSVLIDEFWPHWHDVRAHGRMVSVSRQWANDVMAALVPSEPVECWYGLDDIQEAEEGAELA